MEQFQVLVADAQYLIRSGIRKIVSSDKRFRCIGECSNSAELKSFVLANEFEILVIDYFQNDYFSVEDLKWMKENAPQVKIFVISSDIDKGNIFKALSAGTLGFLTKECDEDEVMSALIATSKGEKFICHKIIDIIIRENVKEEEPDCVGVNLSVRELEIIQLTAKGLSAKEIANQLYISLHTVYTHKKNIMKKLDVNSSSEIILFALKNGMILSE